MKHTIKVKYIEELIADEKIDAAIEYLSNELNEEESADLLIQRGDLYRKIHAFGKALGDYRKALKLEPDNQVAATKLAMVESILSIENTFYYENAYTDESLFPEM